MDSRNVNITNRIYEVLNSVKGFHVAKGDPHTGKIIVRFEDTSFYLTVEPIFNDNKEGREADSEPFEKIVKNHRWIFQK